MALYARARPAPALPPPRLHCLSWPPLTQEKCVAETRARHRGPASSSYELRFHRNAPGVCPSVTCYVGVIGIRDWGRSAQVSVSERLPPGRPELQPRGGPHNGVLDPLEVYRARALAAELERDRSLRRHRADRADRSRLRALSRSLVGMLNVGLRCPGVSQEYLQGLSRYREHA